MQGFELEVSLMHVWGKPAVWMKTTQYPCQTTEKTDIENSYCAWQGEAQCLIVLSLLG